MNKQIFFKVTLIRASTSVGSLEVPVTVDTSKADYMKDAKHLAFVKAVDAVRCKVSLASDIHWKESEDMPSALRLEQIELIPDPKPPAETYSLLCSSILAIVKDGNDLYEWKGFNDRAKGKIRNAIRWLDFHHENLPHDVADRLITVKALLQDMNAPDELIRDLS